jgi:hypothetical protein
MVELERDQLTVTADEGHRSVDEVPTEAAGATFADSLAESFSEQGRRRHGDGR